MVWLSLQENGRLGGPARAMAQIEAPWARCAGAAVPGAAVSGACVAPCIPASVPPLASHLLLKEMARQPFRQQQCPYKSGWAGGPSGCSWPRPSLATQPAGLAALTTVLLSLCASTLRVNAVKANFYTRV